VLVVVVSSNSKQTTLTNKTKTQPRWLACPSGTGLVDPEHEGIPTQDRRWGLRMGPRHLRRPGWLVGRLVGR
jgi:hypothetical protein